VQRRYRALVRFGPWERGDEFESGDPYHARLAAQGRVLAAVDGPSAEERDEQLDQEPVVGPEAALGLPLGEPLRPAGDPAQE
jgi:hypothetical protein